MYNLFTKTLYDKRSFIVGWSFGFIALSVLMLIFYPSFHQDNGLGELVKSLPPAFQSLVGDLNNLKTLPTYLGSQLFNVRIPIFISILSIILSVGLSVGEEEKGQLRTLAGLPLSRGRIFFNKWWVIVLICGVVTLATVAGITLGAMLIHETLDWAVLGRLSAVMWLFAICLATIVFAVGMATGKRGPTMAIGVVIAVGSFILTTFAAAVDWLQSYEKISLLHYFPAADIARSGIELRDVAVYAGLICVFIIIGIVGFRRRDIN
jgi:ABC-2 type transport system permease protein